MTVVKVAKLNTRAACHHRRLHGGARRAAEASQCNHFATDVKVKAHRKIETASCEAERWEILGNDAADTNAVSAQQLLADVGGSTSRKLRDQGAKFEQVCRVLVSVPSLWPRAERHQQQEAQQPKTRAGRRRRAKPPAQQPHQWCMRGEWWVCTVCLKRAKSTKVRDSMAHIECTGIAAKLARCCPSSRACARCC